MVMFPFSFNSVSLCYLSCTVCHILSTSINFYCIYVGVFLTPWSYLWFSLFFYSTLLYSSLPFLPFSTLLVSALLLSSFPFCFLLCFLFPILPFHPLLFSSLVFYALDQARQCRRHGQSCCCTKGQWEALRGHSMLQGTVRIQRLPICLMFVCFFLMSTRKYIYYSILISLLISLNLFIFSLFPLSYFCFTLTLFLWNVYYLCEGCVEAETSLPRSFLQFDTHSPLRLWLG